MTKTFEITISLPATYKVFGGKNDAFYNEVELSRIPVELFSVLICQGAVEKVINDVSRPKDDAGKPMSDDAWKAVRDKRIAPWYDGQWSARGGQRGEQFVTHMRNAFVAEQVAKGKTVKETDALISARVKAVFGKDEKASFDKFLDATATLIAKEAEAEYVDVRSKLEGKYEKLAHEALAATANAVDAIDISDIDLAEFMA